MTQYRYDGQNFDQGPYYGTREELAKMMVDDIFSDFEWRKISVLRPDGTSAIVRVSVTIDPDTP